MAADIANTFLRIGACLYLLFSSYSGVLGSRCTGQCPCELGAACSFAVDANTTLQVAYQLNQTTENQVSLVDVATLVLGLNKK